MTETNTKNDTSCTRYQKDSSIVQETVSSPSSKKTDFSEAQSTEKTSEENVQSSDHEGPKASTGLKRKASIASLTEAKRKRSTEVQVPEESILDPVDPEDKIKNLMFHLDSLKEECIWKDNQIEKLKVELTEKEKEIKRLLATNNRYKSGLACIICTGYLANPCTINCGHSFCYSCLREWLKTNRENGSKCPSCRAKITTYPVLSYVLKDQVEAMIEQLPPEEKKGVLETLEKEDQIYRQISDHWAGIFDPSVRPLLDEEDGVLRCPNCGWEVEGSICGNCRQRIDIENRDFDSVNDDDDNDSDNSEIGNEFDIYDSNDSFIDNGSDMVDNDNESHGVDLFDNDHRNLDAGPITPTSPNESYIIDENEDESRSSNAIVINDSSSGLSELNELSEEQSECDSTGEKNVIVISSESDGDDDDEEPFRVRLNARRKPVYLDQDDENQEITRIFSAAGSEVEYAERNSDNHISSDSDGSRHVQANDYKHDIKNHD
ncbi:RING finger protein PSH1 [Rhizophagus clarus]|uniref:RING finger protein PSH1 n=1 Tax=Rhizophagus clarus TaxID=94130 RepID=A0A8H3LWW9_9GLOM|nr:RING finger protein PSH1 [Rhizophagus clarus]